MDVNTSRFNFPREIRRARVSGNEEAVRQVLDRARAFLRAKGRAQQLARNLKAEVQAVESGEGWHRAARTLVEAAPHLRWVDVLDLMTALLDKKPKHPSRPLWRQLQAATRRATEQCIAGFIEKVGTRSPALEPVRELHPLCREIVDEISNQPKH
jgi:hypothetical protein